MTPLTWRDLRLIVCCTSQGHLSNQKPSLATWKRWNVIAQEKGVGAPLSQRLPAGPAVRPDP
jgi:hypothetical protein